MKIEWTEPALLDLESIRELLFYNYRIMYRVETECILILTVIHGARDLSQGEPKPWDVV